MEYSKNVENHAIDHNCNDLFCIPSSSSIFHLITSPILIPPSSVPSSPRHPFMGNLSFSGLGRMMNHKTSGKHHSAVAVNDIQSVSMANSSSETDEISSPLLAPPVPSLPLPPTLSPFQHVKVVLPSIPSPSLPTFSKVAYSIDLLKFPNNTTANNRIFSRKRKCDIDNPSIEPSMKIVKTNAIQQVSNNASKFVPNIDDNDEEQKKKKKGKVQLEQEGHCDDYEDDNAIGECIQAILDESEGRICETIPHNSKKRQFSFESSTNLSSSKRFKKSPSQLTKKSRSCVNIMDYSTSDSDSDYSSGSFVDIRCIYPVNPLNQYIPQSLSSSRILNHAVESNNVVESDLNDGKSSKLASNTFIDSDSVDEFIDSIDISLYQSRNDDDDDDDDDHNVNDGKSITSDMSSDLSGKSAYSRRLHYLNLINDCSQQLSSDSSITLNNGVEKKLSSDLLFDSDSADELIHSIDMSLYQSSYDDNKSKEVIDNNKESNKVEDKCDTFRFIDILDESDIDNDNDDDDDDDTAAHDQGIVDEINAIDMFLLKCGIKRSKVLRSNCAQINYQVEDNSDYYELELDVMSTIKNVQLAFVSGIIDIDNFFKEWLLSIEDLRNLQLYLRLSIVSKKQKVIFGGNSNLSLVRLLLQVPLLQTKIISSLLYRLNEEILIVNCEEEIVWGFTLIHHLCFLPSIEDSKSLTISIIDLLDTSPNWFKFQLIAVLPDLISEKDHVKIAIHLCHLMKLDDIFNNVILNCLMNLSLNDNDFEKVRSYIMIQMKSSLRNCTISEFLKFCLSNNPDASILSEIITIVRSLDIMSLDNETSEECDVIQVSIFRIVKANLRLISPVAIDFSLKCHDSGPKVFDFMLMLLLLSCDNSLIASSKRKALIKCLTNQICDNYYNENLLNFLYNNCKAVAVDMHSIFLDVFFKLLKHSDNNQLSDFSFQILKHQFLLLSDFPASQRMIITKLMSLIGRDNDIAKKVLCFFCKFLDNEDYKIQLQKYTSIFMDVCDIKEGLDLDGIYTLFDILFGLCTNISHSLITSDTMFNDLIQKVMKQLSIYDSTIKCRGVLGATMAFKYLVPHYKSINENIQEAIPHSSLSSSSLSFQVDEGSVNKSITQLVNDILCKVTIYSEYCYKSCGLFFEKISQLILSGEINNVEFIHEIFFSFLPKFVGNYAKNFIDLSKSSLRESLINANDNDCNAVVHDDHDRLSINICGTYKYNLLSSVFIKLIHICNMKLCIPYFHEEFKSLFTAEIMLSEHDYCATSNRFDLLFNAINWMRELINVCVFSLQFTKEKYGINKQDIFEKVKSLIELQKELCYMLSLDKTSYQPLSCFFYQSEVPLFKIVPLKKAIVNDVQWNKSNKKTKSKLPSKKFGSSKTVTVTVTTKTSLDWQNGIIMTNNNPLFFRQLDTKILQLLIVSNADNENIPVSHVFFILTEVLSMINNSSNDDSNVINELIENLDLIIMQMNYIAIKIGNNENIVENNQVFCLIIDAICRLINWKGFNDTRNASLWRKLLEILSRNAQMNEIAEMKLIMMAYDFFESFVNIALHITVAHKLVGLCRIFINLLDKCSHLDENDYKKKHSQMAYGFLCIDWSDNYQLSVKKQQYKDPVYKAIVKCFLINWFDNVDDPLETAFSVLQWLIKEAEKLTMINFKLSTLPTIYQFSLPDLYENLFHLLIRGCEKSLKEAAYNSCSKLKIWKKIAENIKPIVKICSDILDLKAICKQMLVIYLREFPKLLNLLIKEGIPVMEHLLIYKYKDIQFILDKIRLATHFMNRICNHGHKVKDLSLSRLVPAVKKLFDHLVSKVHAIMIANDYAYNFSINRMVNKDLNGLEIIP